MYSLIQTSRVIDNPGDIEDDTPFPGTPRSPATDRRNRGSPGMAAVPSRRAERMEWVVADGWIFLSLGPFEKKKKKKKKKKPIEKKQRQKNVTSALHIPNPP
jgi:hypothetical protein